MDCTVEKKFCISQRDISGLLSELFEKSKDHKIGESYSEGEIKLTCVESTAPTELGRFASYQNAGVPIIDSIIASNENCKTIIQFGSDPLPTSTILKEDTLTLFITLQAYILMRGDFPQKDSENKMPLIIKKMLEKSKFPGIEKENQFFKLVSSVPVLFNPGFFIPNTLGFQKEIRNRLYLNAAGHKFVHLCRKALIFATMKGFSSSSEARQIIEKITRKYKENVIYKSLMPFSRGSKLPNGKFMNQICNLIHVFFNRDKALCQSFIDLLQKNEIQKEHEAYILGKEIEPRWIQWLVDDFEDEAYTFSN